MDYYFNGEEIAELTGAAKLIMRLVGRTEGRADSYSLRREEFKIIEFPKKTEKEDEL